MSSFLKYFSSFVTQGVTFYLSSSYFTDLTFFMSSAVFSLFPQLLNVGLSDPTSSDLGLLLHLDPHSVLSSSVLWL